MNRNSEPDNGDEVQEHIAVKFTPKLTAISFWLMSLTPWQQCWQQSRLYSIVFRDTQWTKRERAKDTVNNNGHRWTPPGGSPLRHPSFFPVHREPPASISSSKCPSNVHWNPPKSAVVHRFCCHFCCQRWLKECRALVYFRGLAREEKRVSTNKVCGSFHFYVSPGFQARVSG